MMTVVLGLVACLVCLSAMVPIFRKIWRDTNQIHDSEEIRTYVSDGPSTMKVERPRCMACGEEATDPLPTLERGRGSVVRDLLGMPPRYRRVVPSIAPRVLCRSHAHVADGVLADFVGTEVRARLQTVYRQIAERAAVFESEELLDRIKSSLSISQQKKARKLESKDLGAN